MFCYDAPQLTHTIQSCGCIGKIKTNKKKYKIQLDSLLWLFLSLGELLSSASMMLGWPSPPVTTCAGRKENSRPYSALSHLLFRGRSGITSREMTGGSHVAEWRQTEKSSFTCREACTTSISCPWVISTSLLGDHPSHGILL